MRGLSKEGIASFLSSALVESEGARHSAAESGRTSSVDFLAIGCDLIKGFLYDAKGDDREVDVSKGTLPRISKDRLLWIEVDGRADTDLCRIQDLLGLDARVLEGLRKPTGPLTLNNYGDYFHFSVVALNSPEGRDGTGPQLPAGGSGLL